VNEAFAKEYFGGADPVGRWFGRGKVRLQVVGLVCNARYRDMREPITPTAYIPFRSSADERADKATFIVRALPQNPLEVAGFLRSEVSRLREEFRVANIRTQVESNRSQSIRERLLATLSLFFATVGYCLQVSGSKASSTIQSCNAGARLAFASPQVPRLAASPTPSSRLFSLWRRVALYSGLGSAWLLRGM
jgi:hypothetical protein